MNVTLAEQLLTKLYFKEFNENPVSIKALPPSGSYREYYRISDQNRTIIGVYNTDKAENHAFLIFTHHFLRKNIKVPAVIAEDEDNCVYLLEDLGDTTLLNYIQSENFPSEIRNSVTNAYKKVVECLPQIQVNGGKNLDYSACYPRHAFDKQSMMWDLNYFKYYFLKLAKVPFNEQLLEDDFNTFSDFLLTADCNHFLFRDFQSRNIMMVNHEPYFIDYQGGRKGALHYDVASLLFEAKTSLPPQLRDELLQYYLDALNKIIPVSRTEFMKHFYGYVYIRIMQAMGAYGFRGLYEKKELFLQSIPLALNHLEWLLENTTLPVHIPELTKVWQYLAESEYIRNLSKQHTALIVSINSFSYRRGIPVDESLNGGGFVFDCRALHNPGRYEKYKNLNGTDAEVIQFFQGESEMDLFLQNIYNLVDTSVANYSKRGFSNLMINFGCTGGQHRSVYSAEMLYKHVTEKFKNANILFRLRHREQEMKAAQTL